ncbi:MAG: hypothetical protein ABS46_18315 [Cytophagaceae bacterium SCN 52-12]|nr:MAG: hypothetical protein ABS46_18315 [Cytophagaceae bacterium SCN 52-12]
MAYDLAGERAGNGIFDPACDFLTTFVVIDSKNDAFQMRHISNDLQQEIKLFVAHAPGNGGIGSVFRLKQGEMA